MYIERAYFKLNFAFQIKKMIRVLLKKKSLLILQAHVLCMYFLIETPWWIPQLLRRSLPKNLLWMPCPKRVHSRKKVHLHVQISKNFQLFIIGVWIHYSFVISSIYSDVRTISDKFYFFNKYNHSLFALL